MQAAQQHLRRTLGDIPRRCASVVTFAGNRHQSWPMSPWQQGKRKMAVGCAHMHSFQTVFLTLETIREDEAVVDVQFDELLVNGSCRAKKEKIRAVRDLLMDTTKPSTSVPVYRPNNARVRQWDSIVLVDTVSTKEQYREYKEQKEAFLTSLRAYDPHLQNMPLKLHLKIEVHPRLDMFSILQMFQEVIHDPSVEAVELPAFLHGLENHQVADRLVSQLDPLTLAWKGEPLEISVSFADNHDSVVVRRERQQEHRRRSAKVFLGKLDSIDEEESESSEGGPSQRKHGVPTATKELFKTCIARMEKLLFTHSSVLRCSGSKELSVLSSINSNLSTIDF